MERSPRHSSELRALVALRAEGGDFEGAIELSRRLAKQQGEDSRSAEAALLVEMAAAASAEGRSDEARKALKRAQCFRAHLPLALARRSGRAQQGATHVLGRIDA